MMIAVLLYLMIGAIWFVSLLISEPKLTTPNFRKDINKLFPTIWGKRVFGLLMGVMFSITWLLFLIMGIVSYISKKVYELD